MTVVSVFPRHNCYSETCCVSLKGNVGILDISTRSYKTLMRSHTDQILSCSFDPSRRCLVTVSDDETIRVWDLDTLCQLYDFRAAHEKPCAVTFHPHRQLFACGFRNGAVRVFNIGRVCSRYIVRKPLYYQGLSNTDIPLIPTSL